MAVLICETVLGTLTVRIMGSSFSATLSTLGSNVQFILAVEPRTSSAYDPNFDSFTKEIVLRVQHYVFQDVQSELFRTLTSALQFAFNVDNR